MQDNLHSRSSGSRRNRLLNRFHCFGLFTMLAAFALIGAPSTATPAQAAPSRATQDTPRHVDRWKSVYAEYGGPHAIGDTEDEVITVRCQHNGTWGWQAYAWVPSLNAWGWIPVADVHGFTSPINGIPEC